MSEEPDHKLSPCPFCGMVQANGDDGWTLFVGSNDVGKPAVLCTGCDTTGPSAEYEGDDAGEQAAADKWNKRGPDLPVPATCGECDAFQRWNDGTCSLDEFGVNAERTEAPPANCPKRRP